MPIEIVCPSCNCRLRVPDELLGKQVRCAQCGVISTATLSEPAEPPATVVPDEEPPLESTSSSPEAIRTGDDPGAPSYREHLRQDRDWQDEDRPVSRSSGRYRDREEDEDYPTRKTSRAEAASLVSGPAIGLMVVGILAICLSLLSLALNLLGAGLVANEKKAQANRGVGGERIGKAGRGVNAPADSEEEEMAVMVQAVSGVCGALFGILYGTLILVGGVKMKNLSSYGFAMTGSIVAMLPCNLCCLLGLPFGIWAVVVINRPEVRQAFR